MQKEGRSCALWQGLMASLALVSCSGCAFSLHRCRRSMNLRSPYRALSLVLLAFISTSLVDCGLGIAQIADPEHEHLARIVSEGQLAVDSSRELDPIRGKVWMYGFDKEPPLSMLVLSEKATDAEKPAIAKLYEITVAFKNKMVAFMQEYHPLQVGMLETIHANRISLIVELYSRNLSYGDYNKKAKDVHTAVVKQLSDMQLQQSKTLFSCYTIGHQTNCMPF